ncbi:phosphoserine phosphatase [Populus alba x Populus x berolinensis]|nr:phosphoserine phosphatase [Populus alba x Populus x berolinensis]
MLCALMWIARCAWMRALMNLQSFVELERLLQIGLQEQWVVLFPLRRPWLPRLSLFKPSLPQVQEFLETRPPKISPGINELVKKLKAKNTNVYLISGGFRQMINVCYCITGFCLCINAFFFFACCINPWYSTRKHICKPATLWKFWEFVGFDVNEPTSRSGGKATAVQKIRKVHGYKALVMIGDGATDLEARKPGGADLFICYGGVQLREAVAVKADWLVFNFADLINSLE